MTNELIIKTLWQQYDMDKPCLNPKHSDEVVKEILLKALELKEKELKLRGEGLSERK